MSYARRGTGLLIGCAPVVLLLVSIVRALTREDTPRIVIGLPVMLVAVAIGVLNFHLSFVRARLYRRAKGSLDGYQYVSGFPLIGTLVVVAGTALGFGSVLIAALGLLAVGVDTGGSVWFLIATWKDSSLWDRPG